MNRSLSLWAVALAAAALVIVACLAYATHHNTHAALGSERAVAKSWEFQGLLSRLLVQLTEAETGVRGYLLTGDERYLAPYRDSLDRSRGVLRRLTTDLKSRGDPVASVERLEKLITSRHALLQQTVDLHRGDSDQQGFEAARAVVLTDRGRQLMAETRDAVDALVEREAQVLDERLRTADRRATITSWCVWLGNGLALAVMATAAAAMLAERSTRRRAQASLDTQRERMKAVIDAAMVGVIACDEQLRIVLVNPAAEGLHGRRAEQLIGSSLLEMVPESQRRRVADDIAELAHSGETRRAFENGRALRADGSEFQTEGTISKTTMDDGLLYTVMFRDLSDQELARASLNLRDAVIDQIQEAVDVRDSGGKITFWNRGAERLYGWTAEEAIGRSPRELMSPAELPEHTEAERVVTEAGAWSGEVKQVTKERREIVVDQRRSLFYDADGAVAGQLVVNADISQRKQAELEARRNQRLESLGTLAGGVAHDLNNVLTPVLMAGKMLRRNPAAEGRDQLLDTIVASAERGAEMVAQLLAFAGGQSGDRRVVDLRLLLEEAVGILRHTLPKSITLEVDCPVDLWCVNGDPTELLQVVINLAINARDAMPEGGTLSFTAANRHLEETLQLAGDELPPAAYVRLSVADSGSGVPAEIRDHVFEPFFTTKEPGQGTGLGLSTSLGIVRAHHGGIELRNRDRGGATATVYLPADDSSCPQVAEPPPRKLPVGEGSTVLLVDDEPVILEMARAGLESHGYRVLTAGSGVEGMAVFQTDHNEIAVAVVDMMMPGMGGQATIDGMRSIADDVPIIATSGVPHPTQSDSGVRGAWGFLSKPYSDTQLASAIEQAAREGALST